MKLRNCIQKICNLSSRPLFRGKKTSQTRIYKESRKSKSERQSRRIDLSPKSNEKK
jgi:predicted RNA-binding protein with PIN domain